MNELDSLLNRGVADMAMKALEKQVATAKKEPLEDTINGRYRHIKQIGQGGMGTIYLYEDLTLQKEVVLKILNTTDPTIINRFQLEIQLGAKLPQPIRLPLVTDAGTLSDGRPWLVMHYVKDGIPLSTVLKAENLNLSEIKNILKQLTDLLEMLHEAGIYHRDLKGENVLLKRQKANWEVWLIDLGIAHIGNELGDFTQGYIVGSPGRMSPEQLQFDYTLSSDIFQFAILAYESLTKGMNPYNDFDWKEPKNISEKALARLKSGPLPIQSHRPDFSNQVAQVFAKALAYEQADRHPTVTAFYEDLVSALDWPRRRNWLIASSGIVFLLLAVLVSWFLYNIPPTRLSYWLQKGNIRTSDFSVRNGDRFRFGFQAMENGALYVFNEGKLADGKTVYHVLFPTPKNNALSPMLNQGQELPTDDYEIVGDPGTETYWLVWSSNRLPELDAIIRDAANKKTEEQAFLISSPEQNIQLTKIITQGRPVSQNKLDKGSNVYSLSGTSDIAVGEIRLNHQP